MSNKKCFIKKTFHWLWSAVKFVCFVFFKFIKFVYKITKKFLKFLFKSLCILAKKMWSNIWKIIGGIIAIGLLVAPYFVITYLFEKGLLTKNDWGQILGGCLGYYGTIVLGIVAVIQTQISLKQNKITLEQNEETFKADKYSSIEIIGDCTFSRAINNETAYKNRQMYPLNYYCVAFNKKDFEFNKELIFICIAFKYKNENYPLDKLNLKSATFKYDEELYVDQNIKTDLCQVPKTEEGVFKIMFMISEDKLKYLNDTLNKGLFILNLNFEVESFVGVKLKERVEVNLSKYPVATDLIAFENSFDYGIRSVSYNYEKEDENGKRLCK